MEAVYKTITAFGDYAPVICILLFLLASLLVVWRLEALSGQGVEGTVLGTVFMPFCSGMGNIVFALVLAMNAGKGDDVLINCLFNNITNMTLLIGAPVLIWGMASIPRKKSKAVVLEHKMGRLSLALNLVAALFFSLFIWLLAADGKIGRMDGFVLLLLFVFWQCFHVYDVKKTNLLKKKSYPLTLPVEMLLLLIGAAGVFVSTDWLVQWFQSLESDTFPPQVLGWASGVLMVLPNAILAFYYASKARMDVVYTSQSGDAHICIPLCIGIFAVFRDIPGSEFLQQSLLILMGLCAVHLLFVVVLGRLPRIVAVLLLAAFGYFLWTGMA
ncbi:sodium:calcium symporter [Verrucomicrobia bacterium S94]|nr:sodium:calcium symporter [Verrucomicrobia bacterium S94]